MTGGLTELRQCPPRARGIARPRRAAPFGPTTSGRKSPPFWPWPAGRRLQPPQTDLVAWYDAAKGVTFSVGFAVSNWADQTPNHRDQVGSATWVPSAVNGLPGIDFTSSAAMAYTGPSGIALTGPRLIGAVLKPTSAAGGPVVGIRLGDVALNSNFQCDLLTIGATQYFQSNQNFADISRVGAPVDYTGQALAYIVRWEGSGNPASLAASVNGAAIPLSSTSPGPPNCPVDGIQLVISGSQPRDIILCEVQVYAASSAALETALLSYYSQKFGVP